jgi:hypothetical protein
MRGNGERGVYHERCSPPCVGRGCVRAALLAARAAEVPFLSIMVRARAITYRASEEVNAVVTEAAVGRLSPVRVSTASGNVRRGNSPTSVLAVAHPSRPLPLTVTGPSGPHDWRGWRTKPILSFRKMRCACRTTAAAAGAVECLLPSAIREIPSRCRGHSSVDPRLFSSRRRARTAC